MVTFLKVPTIKVRRQTDNSEAAELMEITVVRQTKSAVMAIRPLTGKWEARDLDFDELFAPVGQDSFLSEYWEKRFLHVQRDSPGYYAELLSSGDLDEFACCAATRFSDVRLVKLNQHLDSKEYLFDDGRVAIGDIVRFYNSGFTIIYNETHTRIPTLGELCSNVARQLGFKSQTNVYMTPPESGGFGAHFDTHDVFVLQVHGEKEWTIFDSPIILPLPGQDHESSGTSVGEESYSTILKQGDLLYLPRGLYHQAKSAREMSIHITLGVITRSWCEVLLEAVSAVALREVALRRALPIGFQLGANTSQEVGQIVRDLVQLVHDRLDCEEIQRSFIDQFLNSGCIPLKGQIRSLVDCGRDGQVRSLMDKRAGVR